MSINSMPTLLILALAMTATPNTAAAQAQEKTVIAHRGASGYLPEHTLESVALAHGMGAHYIEQDLVMTADDQLIVLHDLTLERTTNVAELYPERMRRSGEYAGRYPAIDFTLAEIRRLQVHEGVSYVHGERRMNYPARFPLGRSNFRISTFAETIETIQGLNQTTGREVGIYPEIKEPAYHRAAGKDISAAALAVLKDYGYTDKEDKVFLQTFDRAELQRIHDELLPAAGMDIRLVLLISARGGGLAQLLSEDGLARVARYADGIGPNKDLVIEPDSRRGQPHSTGLVERAHAAGLSVHPYTFRLDAGHVPDYADDFDHLLKLHLFTAGVDGVFTDFPDRAVQVLAR